MTDQIATVIATIGKAKVHAPAYTATDWIERDNFASLGQAQAYASHKSRMYPNTPYRIVTCDGGFSVEYVPEWKLR